MFLETIEPTATTKSSHRVILRMGTQTVTKESKSGNESHISHDVLLSLTTGIFDSQEFPFENTEYGFQMEFSQEISGPNFNPNPGTYLHKIWLDDVLMYAKLHQDPLFDYWSLELPRISMRMTSGDIFGRVFLRGQRIPIFSHFSKTSLSLYR